MTVRQAVYRVQRPSTGPSKPSGLRDILAVYVAVTPEAAKAGWTRQYDQALTVCLHGPKCKNGAACEVGRRKRTMHLLGGSLLPIWSTLERVLHTEARRTNLKITRVRTDDGRRLVGVSVAGEHTVQQIERAIGAMLGQQAIGWAPPPLNGAYGAPPAPTRDVKPSVAPSGAPGGVGGAQLTPASNIPTAQGTSAKGAPLVRKDKHRMPPAVIDLCAND